MRPSVVPIPDNLIRYQNEVFQPDDWRQDMGGCEPYTWMTKASV